MQPEASRHPGRDRGEGSDVLQGGVLGSAQAAATQRPQLDSQLLGRQRREVG